MNTDIQSVVMAASLGDNMANYFTGADVRPEVNDANRIVCYSGHGPRRAWGQSRLSSSVVFESDILIVIDVTGWHKHTIRPVGGLYYFVCLWGKWTRTNANNKIVKTWKGNNRGV